MVTFVELCLAQTDLGPAPGMRMLRMPKGIIVEPAEVTRLEEVNERVSCTAAGSLCCDPVSASRLFSGFSWALRRIEPVRERDRGHKPGVYP